MRFVVLSLGSALAIITERLELEDEFVNDIPSPMMR